MDALKLSLQLSFSRLFLSLMPLFIAGSLLSGSAEAAGSAEAGKAKSVTCSACHGMDGNSLNPEWPSIAGQHESYLIKSLNSFRSGERKNVLMSGMAMPLSDEDIKDLAAYFSQQKRAPNVADPTLVVAGERLYRGGNSDSGVPACLACHGPAGRGNPPAVWPTIAGQHAPYAAAQLRAYRSKERSTDGDTQMMRNVSAMLTDDEIKSVTSYIQGLR
jgi:cytochrome c553